MRKFLKKLAAKWMYTDSHATEITLGAMTGVLALPATLLELGFNWFVIPIMVAGLYQVYCVADGDLKCRAMASALNTSAYLMIIMLYGYNGWLTTSPSHSGWIIMALASFATAARLQTELEHRS